MAVKLKLKGLSRFSGKEKLKLGRAIKQSGVMDDIGEDIIKTSKKAKRKGFSTEWSKYRDKLATKNPTDPEYSSGKSNLTFTGGLINSIKVKFVTGQFKIVIAPTGKHKNYKRLTKRKKKKGASKRSSNMDIAIGQKDQGRDTIIVTKKNLKKYGKWIKKQVGAIFTR